MTTPRRQFLTAGATLGLAGLAAGVSCGLAKEPSGGSAGKQGNKDKEAEREEEVSPAEDLMREHGALKRILLVYGEALHRLHANQDVPPKALADTAAMVRSFVEDYHEKLEEDYLFPRFKKANKLVDLVDVLLTQHRAGRRLTDTVLRLSTTRALKSTDDRKTLAETLHLFIRMYNPHAAREDTVLFPAFHGIVSATSMIAWAKTSRRKSKSFSVPMDSRRWLTASRRLRSPWGFTISHSSLHGSSQ